MIRRNFRVLLVMALVCSAVVLLNPNIASAQAPQPQSLTYGDTAQGEITESVKEVAFEFGGKTGEIAVVQLLPDVQEALIGATLKILDSRGETLADSSKLIVFGQLGEIVFAEIDTDDSYTIQVSVSESGRPGKFEVYLLQAGVLEPGVEVSGEVTSAPRERRNRYGAFYAVRSRDPIELVYDPGREDYLPALIVFSVEDGNNLFPAAYLGGRAFLGGSIQVDGSREVRIIGIGDLNFGNPGREENVGEYTLTLSATE